MVAGRLDLLALRDRIPADGADLVAGGARLGAGRRDRAAYLGLVAEGRSCFRFNCSFNFFLFIFETLIAVYTYVVFIISRLSASCIYHFDFLSS